jgi:hypothetical protein
MSGNLNTPLVPISWGELLDKITILEIKNNEIRDDNALANVRKELDLLTSLAADALQLFKQVSCEKENLTKVNNKLWEVEDRIRAKEAAQLFDVEFIELARSVYKTNDERAAIKRRINKLLSSELIEEKSYKPY